MKFIPDVKGVPVRLGCGHYREVDEACVECERGGSWPDPWLIAGEDINLNRLAETRAYRQSKSRRT